MDAKVFLKETYGNTRYQLGGHGKRTVGVLKEAIVNVDDRLPSDQYGAGKVIEDFQQKMADYLGKETAVFFPSGTMAQQAALRIWCDAKGLKRVAYHPLSHLEIHEQDGLKELHGIEAVLLADKERLIELDDIKGLDEEVACILLELPQREIGGQLPDFEELEQISGWCRNNGIKLHLDGARLLETLPYYRKTAAQVAQLFDSVYVSFYKGIGGIAGAILAGDEEFTQQSKIWKRRYGGDLISLYPYILSADNYFDMRAEKMGQYYEEAKELAELFNSCHTVSTLPLKPATNMFHVHIEQPMESAVRSVSEVQQETGIGMTGYLVQSAVDRCSFEISVGDALAAIPKDALKELFRLFNQKLQPPHYK